MYCTIVKSELIVDVSPKEVAIALLEDGRLEEINRDTREESFVVGNIYMGRVKKIMPSLNAAFVDIGSEKDAFIHYLDLGAGFTRMNEYVKALAEPDKPKKGVNMNKYIHFPEVPKEGQITDYLKVGDMILVQISKEPINTKGPRLTAEISFAGRNMVLIPFADKVMVSTKVSPESERTRLRQLVQSIKPTSFGLIVRTVAETKRVAELDNELRLLTKRWEEVVTRLQQPHQVSLISAEMGRTVGIIRDAFNPTFENIQVNDEAVYEEVRAYVEQIAPDRLNVVHYYKDEQPIFDSFGVTRQLKSGFGRTVSLKNGGYLIMERTEALFSIDVNSGSKKQGDDQEANAFNSNMLAANEIAHQLRLRDIGGIIVVDFIDMAKAENQQKLFEHMQKLMELDRAKHNVLKLSKFGLMQITRQRVRPAVELDVREVCPTCQGKGKIQPTVLFTDRLEEEIRLYTEAFGRSLRLYVHPYVYAYIDRGWFSTIRRTWKKKYGVKTIASEQLGLMQYKFTDQQGTELILKQDTEAQEHMMDND